MYIIYVLKCPDSGEIRYVGQTRSSLRKRLSGHIYESCKDKVKYSYKDNWIMKLSRIDKIPIIEEIENFSDSVDIFSVLERETFWIKKYRKIFNLVNATDGGEYSINNSPPILNMKGNKNPMWGKSHSNDTKKLMSDKKIGIYNGLNNPRARVLYQYDKSLNLIKRWEYAKECCDCLNISRGNVSTSAKYNSKHDSDYMIRYGFIFSFSELDIKQL